MARSLAARCVSALLKLQYKPTEAQAEADLERLLVNGETQPPKPKDLATRYEDNVFYANEGTSSNLVVIYVHGGGYQHDFSPFHWKFLKRVVEQTDALVVAPAYHLIPFGTCADAFDLIVPLYLKYADEQLGKKLILMGDSSGGGLALALAEYFKQQKLRMPDELIVMSPWVDASMESPDVAAYADKDPWLTIPWLTVCGRHWAGAYDVHDYRVSPLFGDVSGMTNVLVFVGTRELFYPDIAKFYPMLDGPGNRLVVGKDMNHVFPLLPIPEAKRYQRMIFDTIRR